MIHEQRNTSKKKFVDQTIVVMDIHPQVIHMRKILLVLSKVVLGTLLQFLTHMGTFKQMNEGSLLKSKSGRSLSCSTTACFRLAFFADDIVQSNNLWLSPRGPTSFLPRGKTDAGCGNCSVHTSRSMQHVTTFSRKAKSSDPTFLTGAPGNDDENAAATSHPTVNGEAEEGKRNKRKGTPQRAPLF